GLRNVLLSSEQTINFYGSTSFSARNLTLDTRGLLGYGGQGDAASLSAAGALTLTNSHPTGSGTPIPGTGLGSLSLNAANIDLGPGSVSATGFNTVALNAQQAITGRAATSNSTAAASTALTGNKTAALTTDGSLAMTAGEITTDAGVSMALTAKGAVTLLAPTQAASLSPVTALGGTLSITGSAVELGTQIVMPSGKVSLVSTGGSTAPGSDIVLDSGARVSVAGLMRAYNGLNVPTPGGAVTLTSAGNVNLASGSVIDVSGGTGGTGGSLKIAAATGSVSSTGALLGSGAQGGSFAVDAQSFDFTSLNNALGTGFSGARDFRLRGDPATCAQDCNLVVGAGTAVNASSISLEADDGSVEVDGTLNASGNSSGSVVLAASNSIFLNGSITANATAAGGKGGQVQLDLGNSSTGSLQLNSGSVIDVSGGGPDTSGAAGRGGTVLLRAPGSLVLHQAANGGNDIVLAGNIQGSTRTTLEAVNVYSNVSGGLIDSSGVISGTDIANINSDVANFMANASLTSYGAQLHQALGSSFALTPGVEIDGVSTMDDPTGALKLNTPWDLSTWRYGSGGSIPGVLTLRALGGVTINSQLSDGFAGTTSFTLPTTPGNSWSYRLVAGADPTAANPLTVLTNPTTSADVQIAACAAHCSPNATGGRGGTTTYTPNMIRTGNGFIDVGASGNLVLGSQDADGNWLPGSQAALLYTAGVAGPGLGITGRGSSSLQGLAYPVNGGDINIDVAGDVQEQAPTQFVNSWLWGVQSTAGTGAHPAAWTVNFQQFQQGIGALGGGNVLVHAG
ncbi:MAG TPA: hypothetical protein VI653_29015, partial [Steroidobacteraceae bacterium]